MRRSLGFPEVTPTVGKYLIIIIASYIIFALTQSTSIGYLIYSKFVLIPGYVIYKFEIWRLLTYAFLHDPSSPFHVIFNALLLYMLGTELENYWGEKKFFWFSILAILLGGLSVCLAYFLGLTNSYVLGFSAVTMGLIIIWGLTFKERHIYIFGLLPVSGLQLVMLTIGLEVIFSVSSRNVSSAAHFGGILAGFLMYYFKAIPKIRK